MRTLACLALAALGGCAIQQQSPEQIYKWTLQASDYQICSAVITGQGNFQRIAGHEQQARRLDCAPYANAVIAEQNGRRQEAAAQAASGLLLLQAAQPRVVMQPMPVSPSVICTSRPGPGGTVTTVCP